MKKIILATALMIATVMTANAMSYTKARSEALFLTDKMAYELDLTDYQYDAVYEINLDYFNGLIGETDLFGINWNRRANELGYVLTSWQYKLFLETEYFYRPVVIRNRAIYFAVYDRYNRGHFYRPKPRVYATYHVGTRRYHEKPHNNTHFADMRHKKGDGHKPSGNHNGNHNGNVKPNTGHHNGNLANGNNRPNGNHNGNVKPNTGNNKPNVTVKPNNGNNKPNNGNVKPNNGNHRPDNGNVKPNTGNKPAGGNTSKPANVTSKPNTGNTVKAATVATKPASSTTTRVSRNAPQRSSAAVSGGSNNGRRSK